jgi:pimeloyl-ACP methyl ester carboxylesterase
MTISGYAEVNGAKIYYEIEGAGQVVVLIHGFSLDLRMWDRQIEALTTRYQVLRFDARGFGRSTKPTGEGYAHAADLKALLDYLEIEKAHILGLSLGGRTAVDFVLAYPEMARTLIVVDSVPSGYRKSPMERVSMSPEILDAAKKSGVATARQIWLDHKLFERTRQNSEAGRELVAIVEEYSGWHWMPTNIDPGFELEPNAQANISRIKTPTLVIIGEYDLSVFQKTADLMYSQILGCHLQKLPTGHMPNLEVSELFNDVVLEFLSNY